MKRTSVFLATLAWLLAAWTAHAAHPETAGVPPASPRCLMQAENGFASALWLVEDPSLVKKWEKSDGKDKLPVVNVAKRDKPLYALLFFADPASDRTGRTHIRYDLTVRKPDGEVLCQVRDSKGTNARASGRQNRFALGKTPLKIALAPDDPAGRYTVEATVRDRVSGTEILLEQYFDVHRFDILADYDFSYDYRAELRRRQEKKAEEEKKRLAALLKPLKGISLKQFAVISARAVHGESEAGILLKEKIKLRTWEEASRGWLKRMKKDTTSGVSTRYAAHFLGAGIGRFPDAGQDAARTLATGKPLAGAPPVPFEKWVEISTALSVGQRLGTEIPEIMDLFDMNFYDWCVVNNWWQLRFNEKNRELYARYLSLGLKFRKHYEAKLAPAQRES